MKTLEYLESIRLFERPKAQTGAMERSRIIATIGPSCDNVETLVEMINSGMDVARLNYSHGDFEGKAKTIQNLREAEKIANKPLGLLAVLLAVTTSSQIKCIFLPSPFLTQKENQIHIKV